jgi:hypothetical protein
MSTRSKLGKQNKTGTGQVPMKNKGVPQSVVVGTPG